MKQLRIRLAWFRLNSDGALLALLALSNGFDLLDPATVGVAAQIGFIPPSFYLWTIGYVLSGLLILLAFAFKRIGMELLGRLLLCSCYTIEVVRTGALTGWSFQATTTDVFIWCALVLVCAIRATALLSKHGLAIVIPGRDNPPPDLKNGEGS